MPTEEGGQMGDVSRNCAGRGGIAWLPSESDSKAIL